MLPKHPPIANTTVPNPTSDDTISLLLKIKNVAATNEKIIEAINAIFLAFLIPFSFFSLT